MTMTIAIGITTQRNTKNVKRCIGVAYTDNINSVELIRPGEIKTFTIGPERTVQIEWIDSDVMGKKKKQVAHRVF